MYSNTHRHAHFFSDPFFDVVCPEITDQGRCSKPNPCAKKTTFETPAPVPLKAQKRQTQLVSAGVVHDRVVFTHMLLLVSIT